MDYIKAQSKDYIQDLDSRKLKAGKISFDIDQLGVTSSANLEHTCGYSDIDQRMLDIINSLPGKWNPAKDSEGNAISQTYIFSFGMVGC